MYKSHKIIVVAIFLVTGLISWFAHIEFYNVVSNLLTITSIILGFYIAALASLFGNEALKKMGQKQDKQIKSKTELGVLLSYYRKSIIVSFIVIVLAILLNVFEKFADQTFFCLVYNAVGSVTISLTFVSLFLMFILLMMFIKILMTTNKQ